MSSIFLLLSYPNVKNSSPLQTIIPRRRDQKDPPLRKGVSPHAQETPGEKHLLTPVPGYMYSSKHSGGLRPRRHSAPARTPQPSDNQLQRRPHHVSQALVLRRCNDVSFQPSPLRLAKRRRRARRRHYAVLPTMRNSLVVAAWNLSDSGGDLGGFRSSVRQWCTGRGSGPATTIDVPCSSSTARSTSLKAPTQSPRRV